MTFDAEYAMSILERRPESMYLGVLNAESLDTLHGSGCLAGLERAWFESYDPKLLGYLPIRCIDSNSLGILCSVSGGSFGFYRRRFSVVYTRSEVESMVDPIRAIAYECLKFIPGV